MRPRKDFRKEAEIRHGIGEREDTEWKRRNGRSVLPGRRKIETGNRIGRSHPGRENGEPVMAAGIMEMTDVKEGIAAGLRRAGARTNFTMMKNGGPLRRAGARMNFMKIRIGKGRGRAAAGGSRNLLRTER